ncbi:hypothetical protein RSAG8_04729, partial [Rhizoctonia solani AG-8 WAC10335]
MLREGNSNPGYCKHQDTPQPRGKPQQCTETKPMVYPRGTRVSVRWGNGGQSEATVKDFIPGRGYVVEEDNGNHCNVLHDNIQPVNPQA